MDSIGQQWAREARRCADAIRNETSAVAYKAAAAALEQSAAETHTALLRTEAAHQAQINTLQRQLVEAHAAVAKMATEAAAVYANSDMTASSTTTGEQQEAETAEAREARRGAAVEEVVTTILLRALFPPPPASTEGSGSDVRTQPQAITGEEQKQQEEGEVEEGSGIKAEGISAAATTSSSTGNVLGGRPIRCLADYVDMIRDDDARLIADLEQQLHVQTARVATVEGELLRLRACTAPTDDLVRARQELLELRTQVAEVEIEMGKVQQEATAAMQSERVQHAAAIAALEAAVAEAQQQLQEYTTNAVISAGSHGGSSNPALLSAMPSSAATSAGTMVVGASNASNNNSHCGLLGPYIAAELEKLEAAWAEVAALRSQVADLEAAAMDNTELSREVDQLRAALTNAEAVNGVARTEIEAGLFQNHILQQQLAAALVACSNGGSIEEEKKKAAAAMTAIDRKHHQRQNRSSSSSTMNPAVESFRARKRCAYLEDMDDLFAGLKGNGNSNVSASSTGNAPHASSSWGRPTHHHPQQHLQPQPRPVIGQLLVKSAAGWQAHTPTTQQQHSHLSQSDRSPIHEMFMKSSGNMGTATAGGPHYDIVRLSAEARSLQASARSQMMAGAASPPQSPSSSQLLQQQQQHFGGAAVATRGQGTGGPAATPSTVPSGAELAVVGDFTVDGVQGLLQQNALLVALLFDQRATFDELIHTLTTGLQQQQHHKKQQRPGHQQGSSSSSTSSSSSFKALLQRVDNGKLLQALEVLMDTAPPARHRGARTEEEKQQNAVTVRVQKNKKPAALSADSFRSLLDRTVTDALRADATAIATANNNTNNNNGGGIATVDNYLDLRRWTRILVGLETEDGEDDNTATAAEEAGGDDTIRSQRHGGAAGLNASSGDDDDDNEEAAAAAKHKNQRTTTTTTTTTRSAARTLADCMVRDGKRYVSTGTSPDYALLAATAYGQRAIAAQHDAQQTPYAFHTSMHTHGHGHSNPNLASTVSTQQQPQQHPAVAELARRFKFEAQCASLQMAANVGQLRDICLRTTSAWSEVFSPDRSAWRRQDAEAQQASLATSPTTTTTASPAGTGASGSGGGALASVTSVVEESLRQSVAAYASLCTQQDAQLILHSTEIETLRAQVADLTARSITHDVLAEVAAAVEEHAKAMRVAAATVEALTSAPIATTTTSAAKTSTSATSGNSDPSAAWLHIQTLLEASCDRQDLLLAALQKAKAAEAALLHHHNTDSNDDNDENDSTNDDNDNHATNSTRRALPSSREATTALVQQLRSEVSTETARADKYMSLYEAEVVKVGHWMDGLWAAEARAEDATAAYAALSASSVPRTELEAAEQKLAAQVADTAARDATIAAMRADIATRDEEYTATYQKYQEVEALLRTNDAEHRQYGEAMRAEVQGLQARVAELNAGLSHEHSVAQRLREALDAARADTAGRDATIAALQSTVTLLQQRALVQAYEGGSLRQIFPDATAATEAALAFAAAQQHVAANAETQRRRSDLELEAAQDTVGRLQAALATESTARQWAEHHRLVAEAEAMAANRDDEREAACHRAEALRREVAVLTRERDHSLSREAALLSRVEVLASDPTTENVRRYGVAATKDLQAQMREIGERCDATAAALQTTTGTLAELRETSAATTAALEADRARLGDELSAAAADQQAKAAALAAAAADAAQQLDAIRRLEADCTQKAREAERLQAQSDGLSAVAEADAANAAALKGDNTALLATLRTLRDQHQQLSQREANLRAEAQRLAAEVATLKTSRPTSGGQPFGGGGGSGGGSAPLGRRNLRRDL